MTHELLTFVIFAGMALTPVVVVAVLLYVAARGATRSVGRCRDCDYDLQSLGAKRRCPECGRPFRVNEAGDIIS